MFILSLGIYGVIGAVAGVLAGLLGISGGVVTVPCLYFMFRGLGIAPGLEMHLAIGTSLASMVINALSATYVHAQNRAVIWEIVKRMTPGIVLGSIIGAFMADLLSGVILEMLFGFFACLLGVYFLRPFTHKLDGSEPMPSSVKLNSVGAGIAAISNILGIGGGILTVPALLHFKVPEKKAIGTAAATGVLITALGALAYLVFGYSQTEIGWSIGFLYLPAFVMISLVSFITARLGASLTHRLSPAHLRRLFALALLAVGLAMLFT